MREGNAGRSADDAVQFGWRVHQALDSWTGKVDTKASIALAIESAVVGFVITLSRHGGQLSSLTGFSNVLYYGGLVLLLCATVLALSVVMPQLNRRRSKREWSKHMIYFGHLRHWKASALAKQLQAGMPETEQLATQLVAMSKIAWRKHAALQYSLIALVLGVLCLLGAAI